MTETQIEFIKELAKLWDKLEQDMSTTIDSFLTRQGLEEREGDILGVQKRAQIVWHELNKSGLSKIEINDEVNKVREVK
jgi:1,6-anhydro-N-acetylmuramate kinase